MGGFLGKLGGALMAPGKAIGSMGKAAMGSVGKAVTGHPMAAAKQLGGGVKKSSRAISRGFSGRR